MIDRAILFDFFGTLVEYQPDRSRLGYPKTHRLARSFGFRADHSSFVEQWDTASTALETTARRTLREFSMFDAARAFAERASLNLEDEQLARLAAAFLGEWRQHIHPIPGVTEMIQRLSDSWLIGVVSNTHDPRMVPDMLDQMGLDDFVSTVVLSVDHGWMKPHESIYRAALDELAITSDQTLFVGDNHDADYVGPLHIGLRALLIDPDELHEIPTARRLPSILDLEWALDDHGTATG